MDTVGTFEAKTHLSALLERVKRGHKILITKHGAPAAMLVPVDENRPKRTHEEIVEGFRALRKRVKRDSMSVRDMIREGRRF
jgi:prevent-host-death family protein